MVVQFKTINKVKFPVYILGSGNWSRSDGLLFLDGEIVDDKNMPGDTLGIRRIQTPHKNIYRLKSKIDDLRGLLKANSKHFIDSNGIPFIYEKTQFCKLKDYRIKNVVKKDTACLLYLWGVKAPFVIPRPPPEDIRYAGVLHFHGLPWILYDYAEASRKETRKKV